MCSCIDGINRNLTEHGYNARLQVVLSFDGSPVRPFLPTEAVEKRRGGKKAPVVVANFGPFCGGKYEKAAS